MATPFYDEKAVTARFKDAAKAIRPQVAKAIKVRDEAARHLEELEAQVSGLQAKRREHESAIESLKAESIKLGKAGNDPLQSAGEVQEQRVKVELIDGLLVSLEADIQQALSQGQQAQEQLYDAWKIAEASYLQGVQAEFMDMHKWLSQFHAAYCPALRQVFDEIIKAADHPRFALKYPRGVVPPPVAHLRVERASSLYELNPRQEVPMVGSAALK